MKNSILVLVGIIFLASIVKLFYDNLKLKKKVDENIKKISDIKESIKYLGTRN